MNELQKLITLFILIQMIVGGYSLFEKNQDIQYCKEFKNKAKINICVKKSAIDNEDADLCVYTQGDPDKCFFNVAMALQDNPSICRMIKNIELHDACLLQYTQKNISGLCPYIKNEYMKRTCELI